MKSEKERISLLNTYVDSISVVNKIEVAVQLFLMTLIIIILLTIGGGFLSIILSSVLLYISLLLHKSMKKRRRMLRDKYFIRDRLRYFIQANHLYEESTRESEQRDNQGHWKIVREKYISNSAEFSYEETEKKLILYAHKNGDNLTAKMSQLEEALRALFGLDIEQVLDRNTVVEYHMIIESPERLDLTTNEIKIGNSLDINLGYDVTYNPVKCPHILISGGTGSGKSIFISFLLLEFLKRKTTVYICDPKNSDLGSLSHYLGEENVATTPNNIARVLRLAVEEMEARYNHMNENFRYGSNFSDHGYSQIWVIADEIGALQATGTDKKSKEIINECMDYLKKIILLGRQAGVFILVAAQQMRSETLSTDLRDNLGLRIALGANSQEGYRMIFGSSMPETLPPIEVKGSGLLYMQGSGKETAQYWESPFVDMLNFNFIEELKRYI